MEINEWPGGGQVQHYFTDEWQLTSVILRRLKMFSHRHQLSSVIVIGKLITWQLELLDP